MTWFQKRAVTCLLVGGGGRVERAAVGVREEKELVCIVSDCTCDSKKLLVNSQQLKHTIELVELFVGFQV